MEEQRICRRRVKNQLLNELAQNAADITDEEFYAALGTIYQLLNIEEPNFETHMD